MKVNIALCVLSAGIGMLLIYDTCMFYKEVEELKLPKVEFEEGMKYRL